MQAQKQGITRHEYAFFKSICNLKVDIGPTVQHVIAGHLVPFAQKDILDSPELKNFEELHQVAQIFNGLCEIICNAVIKYKLLGKTDKASPYLAASDTNNPYNVISLVWLNNQSILKSHIMVNLRESKNDLSLESLDEFSLNMLTEGETNRFVDHDGNLNFKTIHLILKSMGQDQCIKYYLFKLSMTMEIRKAHSMLIMMTGEEKNGEKRYSIFDPNWGEFTSLSIAMVCVLMQWQAHTWASTFAAFVPVNKFKQFLVSKGNDLDKDEGGELKNSCCLVC